MKIEIKPAPRSNPEGIDSLPWNIWKNGVNTNVKPTKAEAERAADVLRRKLSPTAAVVDEELPKKHFMEVPRPRGCPLKGERVKFVLDDGEIIGVVVDYLSTQFLVEYMFRGKSITRVLGVDHGDWKVV